MLSRVQINRLSNADLLTKICEESSEVIKAACKHAAHGATPLAGGVQYNNVRDTNDEFCQLTDLMYEYRRRFGYVGFRPLNLKD